MAKHCELHKVLISDSEGWFWSALLHWAVLCTELVCTLTTDICIGTGPKTAVN